MSHREVRPWSELDTFKRGLVATQLDYPHAFVRWCRKQVGMAPNVHESCDYGCVIEQYLYEITGVRVFANHEHIYLVGLAALRVVTPTWVQRVIDYVDSVQTEATYNDVANMLMLALERNELA